MAKDRRNVIRAAENLVQRGKLEAAIREYRKVLRANPDDTTILNRVGDLYARLSRLDEAVDLFSQAAEHFVHEGFLVKAIAIYKKIIRLDPTRIGIYETLADLYHRQGLRNEARSQYQVVADYYAQAGDSAKQRSICEKVVDLEPDNLSHRVKLAELYCEASLIAEALEQYQSIASVMLQHGRTDDALQVYRGAFELSPDDLGFLADIVLHLADSGHPEAAERMLEHAVRKNPEATRVREVTGLGVTAAGAGEAPKTLETTEEVVLTTEEVEGKATAAVEPEVEEEVATASVDEVMQLGEDEEVVLIDLDGESSDLPFAIDEVSTSVETPDEEAIGELELDLESLESAVAAEAGAETAEDAGAEAVEPETEAVEEEEVEERVEVEETAADAEVGEPGAVTLKEVLSMPIEIGEIIEEPPRAEEAAAVDADLGVIDLLTEARVLANYGLAGKAVDLCGQVLELAPDNAEALGLLVQAHSQLGEMEQAADAASRLRIAAEESAEAMSLWEQTAERLDELGLEVRADTIQAPSVEEEAAAPALEADADIPAAPEEAVLADAGEPLAWEDSRPGWLEEPTGDEQSFAETEEIFGAEDEFFDLAAELEEELQQEEERLGEEILPQIQEQSLEEIVEGFKRGVAETLSEEDHETHYNLGIAYREMGLTDEAIGEFQLAAKSPSYLVDCCSLLGTCFLEKGFPDLAIKWYERGLEAPQVTENESLGLLYELGNLYLATGDREVARKTFAEIYGINSNYRDVVAKLEELKTN